MLDLIDSPTLVLGPGFRILAANQRFFAEFRLTPEAVRGHNFAAVAHWPRAAAALRIVASSGTPATDLEVEAELDGRGRRVLNLSARRLAGGRLLCSLIDITEHQRAQALLQDQVEHLGGTATGIALLEVSPAALRLRYVNGALEAMAGRSAGEFLGRDFLACFPRLTRAAEALRGSRAAVGEAALRRPDDALFPVRWSVGLFHCDSIRGGLVELHDLWAERRAFRSLLESEKMAANGRLAASLAHEINNPLGVVNNALFALRDTGSLDAAADRLAATAAAEIKRIGHIVHSALGLYRGAPTLEVVDANRALDSALEVFADRVRHKRLRVERRYRATWQRKMTAGELRQVLVNLLDNATDAAPESGHVALTSRNTVRGVRLVVADDGAGVAPGLRPRLFRPFATTKGAHGTGLGLWVATELLRKYGGALRVKSVPGATAFAVSVPSS